MSVRYATPGGGKLNNTIVMQGLSIDNAEVNSCSSYVTKRKKEAHRRDRALSKCFAILDTIHRKKLRRQPEMYLREWLDEKAQYEKMLKAAHFSQLEYILERYSNAKNQETIFIKELRDL